MSMISSQIDELRKWADLYDGTAKPALSAELQRPYLAHGLRDAADTIWQLRCRLVDAEDRVRKSGELCKLCEREAEADRLREAVATAVKVQAVLCGDADSLYCHKECPLHRQESDDCLACDVIGVAQELGIEVE